MKKTPKRVAFVAGDTTMTFSPDDIEAVCREWEAAHPGKVAERDMTPGEFATACMARIKASARPTRTVLHN